VGVILNKEDAMHEDVETLEEALEEAKAELETLRDAMADREARAAQLETEAEALREQLARSQEASEAKASEAASAAQRYRALVLERSPELPEDLVTGTTVEEIDEAVERARETVSKVVAHLESKAAAGRVPVGAPARSQPDISRMSTEEKIALGLRNRVG
jgi:chromosome segregation ATPase